MSAVDPAPDFLTCGLCLKEFALTSIVDFIFHKAHGCSKDSTTDSTRYHDNSEDKAKDRALSSKASDEDMSSDDKDTDEVFHSNKDEVRELVKVEDKNKTRDNCEKDGGGTLAFNKKTGLSLISGCRFGIYLTSHEFTICLPCQT